MPTSRNTLLRLLRQLAVPSVDPPRVVGIDDWAKRKGHRYGTIVVDLETRNPIALLEDRSAETVETWLKDHPGVEIVSRDRAEAYAAGVTAGAPDAVQVVDRWHLLKNLREAIEQELAQHETPMARTTPDDPTAPDMGGDTRETTRRTSRSPEERADKAETADGASLPASTLPPRRRSDRPLASSAPRGGHRAEAARQQRRTVRREKYTRMQALLAQGLDQTRVARAIGMSERTVTRWRAADGFPERKPRSGDTSTLDPYKATLLERWRAGCHNATHLWRMIQALGFGGGYDVVANYLAPLRRGEAQDGVPAPRAPGAVSATLCFYTARQAAFLFLRQPSTLTRSEQQDLTCMQEQDRTLAAIYQLTQDLASLVRERQPEHLDAWLTDASTSDFPEVRRFAKGMRQDYAAVRAALELPWSQGPVEGHITKLKLVKRHMYGRGKLDLLRIRLMHAA